jgi:hypothetical protein
LLTCNSPCILDPVFAWYGVGSIYLQNGAPMRAKLIWFNGFRQFQVSGHLNSKHWTEQKDL